MLLLWFFCPWPLWELSKWKDDWSNFLFQSFNFWTPREEARLDLTTKLSFKEQRKFQVGSDFLLAVKCGVWGSRRADSAGGPPVLLPQIPDRKSVRQRASQGGNIYRPEMSAWSPHCSASTGNLCNYPNGRETVFWNSLLLFFPSFPRVWYSHMGVSVMITTCISQGFLEKQLLEYFIRIIDKL